MSVANGGEWLGRQCEGASVAVLALEEHLAGYRDRMVKLGMSRNDPIYSHVGAAPVGAAPASDALEWVTGILDRYRPGLLIVDTMARLIRPAGGDFNEYGAAGDALAPFAKLARARGVHLALVHHARKGGGDFGEQALGSTAWAGGVDTVIDLRRDPKDGTRFVESQNRYGEAIEATALEFPRRDRAHAPGGAHTGEGSRRATRAIRHRLAGRATRGRDADRRPSGRTDHRVQRLRSGPRCGAWCSPGCWSRTRPGGIRFSGREHEQKSPVPDGPPAVRAPVRPSPKGVGGRTDRCGDRRRTAGGR